MKFLVPNYGCLQNPWLGGYRPQNPVLSVLNWICWNPPPLGTPLTDGTSRVREWEDGSRSRGRRRWRKEQKTCTTNWMVVAGQQKWNEAVFCTHTVPVMLRRNYTGTAGEFAASECVDAKPVVRMYDQLACQEPKVKVARDRMRFGCAYAGLR